MLKTLSIFFAFFIVCSCNEYNKQRAEEKAEIIEKSNSLNYELKKMEDTIYKYEVIKGDTIKWKQFNK